jgi:hypothetical protein
VSFCDCWTAWWVGGFCVDVLADGVGRAMEYDRHVDSYWDPWVVQWGVSEAEGE